MYSQFWGRVCPPGGSQTGSKERGTQGGAGLEAQEAFCREEVGLQGRVGVLLRLSGMVGLQLLLLKPVIWNCEEHGWW